MDAKEFELSLSDLETRIARLRALYDQYFQGIERIEPQIARKEVERMLDALRRERPRNTALRFRYQTLLQRWTTFTTHWGRIARQIEEGTFKRDILRARRKAQAIRPSRESVREEVLDESDMITEDGEVDALFDRALGQPTAPPPSTETPALTPSIRAPLSPFQRVPRTSSNPPPAIGTSGAPMRTFGVPQDRPTAPRAPAEPPRPLAVPIATSAAPSGAKVLPGAPPSSASLRVPQQAPSPSPPSGAKVLPGPPPPSGSLRAPQPTPAVGIPRPAIPAPSGTQRLPTPPVGAQRPVIAPPASPKPQAPPLTLTDDDNSPLTRELPRAAPPAAERGTAKIAQPAPPRATEKIAQPAPRPAAVAPARATEKLPRVEPASGEDAEMRRVYDRYIAARKKNNEPTDVSYAALSSSLKAMMPKLKEKHASDVRFDVVLKNGKVALKPVPKKDEPKK